MIAAEDRYCFNVSKEEYLFGYPLNCPTMWRRAWSSAQTDVRSGSTTTTPTPSTGTGGTAVATMKRDNTSDTADGGSVSSSLSSSSSCSFDLTAILDSFLDAFGHAIIPQLTELLSRASVIETPGAVEHEKDRRDHLAKFGCDADGNKQREKLRPFDQEQSLESMSLFRQFQSMVEAPLAKALSESGFTEEEFVTWAQRRMGREQEGKDDSGDGGGGGGGGGGERREAMEEGGLELLVTLLTTVNDYKLFLDIMMDPHKAQYFLSTLRTWYSLMVQRQKQREVDNTGANHK